MSNLYSNKLYYCVLLTQFILLLYFISLKFKNKENKFNNVELSILKNATNLKFDNFIIDTAYTQIDGVYVVTPKK